MSACTRRSFLAGLAAASIPLRLAQAAAEPQVWFSPRQPSHRATGPDDWLDLARNPAAWQPVLQQLSVFEFSMEYLEWVPDDQLGALLAVLRRNNVRTSLGLQSIARQKGCGIGEGYEDPAQADIIARKLSRLNAQLDMVQMDGPLWTGRYKTEGHGCHLNMPDLAAAVARNLQSLMAGSPGLVIGEVEPVPNMFTAPDWQQNLDGWRQALQSATGKKLSFLTFDIDWNRPNWQDALRTGFTYGRSRGLQVGVIYNGLGRAVSNAEWVQQAKGHVTQIEGQMGLHPDFASFASWDAKPTVLMPIANPNSHLGLVRWYLDQHE